MRISDGEAQALQYRNRGVVELGWNPTSGCLHHLLAADLHSQLLPV